MSTTADVFVADPEGWRSQNLDRPPAHLVRELIQNALDETGVTSLDVVVTYHGPRQGTTVKVTDNAPNGVTDAKLLFTIFLSNKEDSPVKRGRMGRGFKEIVSVANMTTIRSAGMDAMRFVRHQGGRWERKTLPKLGRTMVGTEVEAFCRAWGSAAAKSIITFLKRVRAPQAVTMRVAFVDETVPTSAEWNMATGESRYIWEVVTPFTAAETYDVTLPTVIYELDGGDRKARDRERITKVECFSPPPGEEAYIYELGIPVEACPSSPVSMDVQQRVILRERRDTVTDSYRRQLLAKVVDKRVGLLSEDELRSNSVLTASQSLWDMSFSTRKRIAEAWTGGMPYAVGKEDFQRATGHHVPVLKLSTLPEAIRDLVKQTGTNVHDVLEQRKAEFCPPVQSMTAGQTRLVAFWQWLAEGIKRPCTVVVCKGRPGALADFDRSTRTLRLYEEALGLPWFENAAGAEQLGLFIHEMSHWIAPSDGHEHGLEFHADAENVGGEVAAFLFTSAEQARLALNKCKP